MADPLSIASGVAGIVSLGITVYTGLQTYVNAIKGRGEDIESTSQLLTLLRSYIDLIGSSTSTLVNRYARVTQGIYLGLKLCESQLKTLESVVKDLGASDNLQNASSKWKKQKAAALYPFNRTKLMQMQDLLLKTTGVLGTFVQSLILNVNIGMDENLEAFKNAVNESNLITHEVLAQIKEQTAMVLNSHALLHESNRRVSTKLDVITFGMRETRTLNPPSHGRLIEGGSRSGPLTTTVERLNNTHLATPQCSCGKYRARKSYRRQTHHSWVGVTISKAELYSIHRPGCSSYTEPTSTKSTKTTVTYYGLRRFLSRVLDFSLDRDCRAGTCSVSFGLRTYIFAQCSPAQCLCWSELRQFAYNETCNPIDAVNSLKRELDVVYRSHQSSPLEVDFSGENIAHDCMWILGIILWHELGSMEHDAILDAMRILLPYLRTMGVKVNETDLYNRTPFSMTMKGFSPNFISCVYDILEEFDTPFVSPAHPWVGWDHQELQNQTQWIDTMSNRLDIAQDCGYGDLAMAIFQKNERRIQTILDSGDCFDDLFETNICQRHVLHLCNNWPAGLRLLLHVERIRTLLNVTDYIKLAPVDYALISSGSICKSFDRWVECQDCSCCDGLQIFLDMDCKVVVDSNRAATLKLCSMRARKMLLQSLKNRRERLFDIAMTHLSAEDLPDPATWGVKVPDVGAELLRDELNKKGVKLGDALDVNAYFSNGFSSFWGFRGFFYFIHCPKVAEMAFNLGFLDIDEPDSRTVTPILELGGSTGATPKDYLLYADWLLQKGANLDHSVNSAKISSAHLLAQYCTYWIYEKDSTAIKVAEPLPSEYARILSAVCGSKARSCIPCPCITDERSRPLHHLLVGLQERRGVSMRYEREPRLSTAVQRAKAIIAFLTRAVSDVDEKYMAKSIIHTLTLGALDIKHLGECDTVHSGIYKWSEDKLRDPERQEEWNEILDEHRLLIERLRELTKEFEDEFLQQNISIANFLQDYWLPRMRQVQRQLKDPITEDQKQCLEEAGVVLVASETCNEDFDSSEDEGEQGNDDQNDNGSSNSVDRNELLE